MALTRDQYDRLKALEKELKADDRQARYVASRGLQSRTGATKRATHVCLTCQRLTGVPEFHRGHRVVVRPAGR